VSSQFLVADLELSYFFTNFEDLLFIRGVVVVKQGVARTGVGERPWLNLKESGEGLDTDHEGWGEEREKTRIG